ncbi:MAG TPA: phage holin family protein [Thermoanaerobaculia bacterium]|nr:phage holin family protein [Thermoanaerobaculia bacterium]
MNHEGISESLGRLVKGLLEDVSTLFRSEVALAKMEIRQAVAGLGGVGALLAAAVLFALLGLAFVFVTLVLVLALVIPAWASALIVAILLFALSAAAALAGRSRLKKTDFAPLGAIRGVRQDVEMIRHELRRVRGKDDDEP